MSHTAKPAATRTIRERLEEPADNVHAGFLRVLDAFDEQSGKLGDSLAVLRERAAENAPWLLGLGATALLLTAIGLHQRSERLARERTRDTLLQLAARAIPFFIHKLSNRSDHNSAPT